MSRHEARGGALARATADDGYAMAALLIALVVLSVMASAALPVWKQSAQRENEAELIFRGEQYARAIGLFQRKMGPGTLPPNIDLLVDQRFLRKKYKDPITQQDFQPLLAGQAVGGATPGPPGGAPGGTPRRDGAQQPGGQQPPGATEPGRTPTPGGQPTSGTPGPSRPAVGTQPGVAAAGIIGVASRSTATSIRQYQSRTHYNEWTFLYVAQTQTPGAPGGAPGPGGVPGGVPGGIGTQRPGPSGTAPSPRPTTPQPSPQQQTPGPSRPRL